MTSEDTEAVLVDAKRENWSSLMSGVTHPGKCSGFITLEKVLPPLEGAGPEKIPTTVFPDSHQASLYVATEIAKLLRQRQGEGRSAVIGLATGSTPRDVYRHLVKMHQTEGLSFRNAVTFNLDEYWPMEPGRLQSYVSFMNEHLFNHVDIDRSNVHIPDGTVPLEQVAAHCAEYERRICEAGGLDLQLLGIGATGHIGFNEPGSTQRSATRLVTLSRVTRMDAASDFFAEEAVPLRAITMGVATILKSRRLLLMAWGEGKAAVVKAAVEGDMGSTLPATFLQCHPNAGVVLDPAAAAQLTRLAAPWLVQPCDWSTPHMPRKAVVWLAERMRKPVLKLSVDDYLEHGLADLVTQQGPYSQLNVHVFRQLQDTITGWPGGKPGEDDSRRPERAKPYPKRVLIFSPHPDDDVICLGGTMMRMIAQGHELHCAYQTSGSIAVHDDNALRFMDFCTDFAAALGEQELGQGAERLSALHREVRDMIRHRTPGQADSEQLLRVKALIRRGEAKAACRYVGVPDENVHFLGLPFYETGKVKKKPLSQADVDIVVALLRRLRPHQIFAAGDLTDPHGTHRVCLQAVFQALDQLRGEQWMQDCYVWLYRGAWEEWGADAIDMAVPLSPDELMRKRRAIFKHESQKDKPLFPGHDDREFWQRAEDRNRATAQLYDRLGLAEYEALEAFVRYHL